MRKNNLNSLNANNHCKIATIALQIIKQKKLTSAAAMRFSSSNEQKKGRSLRLPMAERLRQAQPPYIHFGAS